MKTNDTRDPTRSPAQRVRVGEEERYSERGLPLAASRGLAKSATTKTKAGRAPARTLLLLALCGIAAFVVLTARLYKIQIEDNNYYESRALANQLGQTELSSLRGSIYDSNGKILAMSTEVETVFISPYEISRDNRDITLISEGLAEILGVDAASIADTARLTAAEAEIMRDGVDENEVGIVREYQVIKEGLGEAEAGRVRDFIRDNELTGIHLEPAAKRYYPNGSLAGQVLGFTGAESRGLYGLEYQYNSSLTGTEGRRVALKNALGRDLTFDEYNDYYAAENGSNLTLTIDSSIQYYVEKHLERAIEDYDVLNGASCIAMDVNTGAILALANYPDYDPNNYERIGERELAEINAIEDDAERRDAYDAQLLRQWSNKAIAETYEPGSVFKIMTLAMALEENAAEVDVAEEAFFCDGEMDVLGREEDDPLHCWNLDGHGMQTAREAIQNSCNIAAVNMAFKLGAETFYKYVEAFGLQDKTGLSEDVEGTSQWWDESVFTNSNNLSQLAAASFGQTFKVTPLQMITAAAATVNGGYLMEPYIVSQISDGGGNIIEAKEPTVRRQVISSETSAEVRDVLESVVSEGSGKNAQVIGYKVGGKTGTSENIEQLAAEEDGEVQEKDYITSFLGFAPADDPEIIILLMLDTPSHETELYISGGAMAAPVVGNMLADILPLGLGIAPEYSEEDLSDINIAVPRVTELSVAEARELLERQGFELEVAGEGDTVTGQLPAPNAYVSSGTKVIAYAGEILPGGTVTVPDLKGSSYRDARLELEGRGLFIRTVGAPKSHEGTEVSVQSVPAGEDTPYGTIVEITLIDKDAVERN